MSRWNVFNADNEGKISVVNHCLDVDDDTSYCYGNITCYNTNTIKEVKWAKTFLNIADTLGQNSHCVSKKVGCVIARDNRIISTGINGTPYGMLNCDDIFSYDFDRKLHHDFSQCTEIHAEENGIVSAARYGISLKDTYLYVNIAPCTNCAKTILASGIKKVFFRNFYMNDLFGFAFLVKTGMVDIIQLLDDTEYFDSCIDDIVDNINTTMKDNFVYQQIRKNRDEWSV